MEEHMVKAAVLYGFYEPLKVESLTLKPPRADEVVVKIVASGICHTDLSVIQARLPHPPPVVLGHEAAGIVEEVGTGVTRLQPGDHVVLSAIPSCGQCFYCIAGESHLCEAGNQAMMEGQEGVFEKDGLEITRFVGLGSFAERTVVRAAAAIKIPPDVPLDRACLVGCGVITGVGAVMNCARVRPGQTVAVFGCGGVGLNVIQGAVLCGAATIIAVDLLDQKLEWAKQFGATHTVNPRTAGDAAEAVRSLTSGIGADFAFEVIGAPPVITECLAAVRRGGKVIVVGAPGFGEDLTVPAAIIPLEEKSIIGTLLGSANMHRDMPKLLELYMQKKLKLDELISRRIALEEINEAFAAMEKGEVARTVIIYGS
jgi:S-(hydroxymethyl)glutathione dehydrogenase/alcohol dehydrogenase